MKLVLVPEAVGSPLNDADLGVQALDKAERHLVLRLAVGGDAVPVTLDHLGEGLVGFETLPLEGAAPVLEEPASPAFPPVVPELSEGLLEHIGGVEALVGGQEGLQRLAPV